MDFSAPRCVKWRFVLAIVSTQIANNVSGFVINTTPSRIVAADLHSRPKPIVHPFRGPRIQEVSDKTSKASLFVTFSCNKSTLDICNDRCVLRHRRLRGNCDEGVCICVKNRGLRSYRPPAGKNGLEYKTNCSVKEKKSKCLGHCLSLKRGLVGVCTEDLCECVEESSSDSERNLRSPYRQSESRNPPRRRIQYTRPRIGRGSPSAGRKYRGSYSAKPKRKIPSRSGSRSKRRNDFYKSPRKPKSTSNPPKRGNFNSKKTSPYGVDRNTAGGRRRDDDDAINALEALKNPKFAGGDREGIYNRPPSKEIGVPGKVNTSRPPTPKNKNNYDALGKTGNISQPSSPGKKNESNPFGDAAGLKKPNNLYHDPRPDNPKYDDQRLGDQKFDDSKDYDDTDGPEALKNSKFGDGMGMYDKPQVQGTGVPGQGDKRPSTPMTKVDPGLNGGIGNNFRPPTPKNQNGIDAFDEYKNPPRPPSSQKNNGYDPLEDAGYPPRPPSSKQNNVFDPLENAGNPLRPPTPGNPSRPSTPGKKNAYDPLEGPGNPPRPQTPGNIQRPTTPGNINRPTTPGNINRPTTPGKNDYNPLENTGDPLRPPTPGNKQRPPTPGMKNDYDPYGGGLGDPAGLKNPNDPYGDQKLDDPQYGDPKLDGPQYGDPKLDGPQYGDPKFGYDEPGYDEPKYGGPGYDNPYGEPALNNANPDVYKQPGINPGYEEDPYYGSSNPAFEGSRTPGRGGPSNYDTYNPYGNQNDPYGNFGDDQAPMPNARRDGPAAYNPAAANTGNYGY